MEAIRAFIAIELPPDVKAVLDSIQFSLKKPAADSVKWVKSTQIHLTLKFLGNVPTTQIDAIAAAMRKTAAGIHPFELHIQSLGVFPNLNRVRVIWVGLDGDLKSLINLQQTLDIALSELAYPLDQRPFTPHLTLGRVRDNVALLQQQAIGKAVAAFKIESPAGFQSQSFCLMQSELLPSGPIHTCLHTIVL